MLLLVGLILALPCALQAASGTWNVDADGNWNVNGNWTGATFPNASNQTATLGGAITADRVITLGQNIQVSTLTFNDDNKYTVTGANTLTVNTITESNTGAGLISATTVSNGNSLLTLNGSGGGTITISSVISGTGGLTASGSSGTVFVLSGANTYSGTTTINSGAILDIRSNAGLGTTAGSTTVNSGGQLRLQGNISTGEAITINSTGVSGTGAISNVSGNNTISGAITVGSHSTIASESGTLTLSGAFGKTGPGKQMTIGYTGGGGGGTVVLSGGSANSVGSFWALQSGTLVLNKTAGVNAVDSFFHVGNNDSGGANTVVARLNANDQIPTIGVNVYATGLLDINGKSETIGALGIEYGNVQVGDGGSLTISTLSMKSGSVGTGTGTLTLGGNVTGVADTNPSPSGAVISGNLALGSSTRTFDIADTSGVADDMLISAAISGTGGLTKSGAGNLTLSGNNTFTGDVLVNSASILTIQHNNALGNISAGTTVNAGGILQIQGGVSVGQEAILMKTSGGTSSLLLNVSGDNSIAGNISGSGAGLSLVQIGSDSGTLTLSGVLSSDREFQKVGAGTVVFSGNNTYTSATTVTAGVLNIQHANALGTTGGSTSVSSGATLQIQGGIAVGTEAISLAGEGVSNAGALRSVSGVNSMAGDISLGSSTAIGVDAGSTLTLSGVVSGGTDVWLLKRGDGTLTLTGNNTVVASMAAQAGVLRMESAGAFGGGGTWDAGGTIADPGGAIELNHATGFTVGASEEILLKSAGISNTGGIRNIGGNNTIAGSVVLDGADNYIGVDAGSLTITGVVSELNGPRALTKVGAGTVTLNGTANNTFTGATVINAGTLDLAATGALNSTSSITVNSGGTLLFSGSSTDRIGDSVGITLAGGTLTSQDKTETMGALTLTASSVINLGNDAGNDDLTFASATYSGGTLTINGWSGVADVTGTDDRIFITAQPSQAFLDGVTFTGFDPGAAWLGTGELVPHPIPEPGTMAAGALLVLLFGWRAWRRPRRTDC